MTFYYSTTSLDRLDTCCLELREVFSEVIKHIDCTIICGHRNEEDQNEAFRTGHSEMEWPDSSHNQVPSNAVDVAPYPIRWKDREGMTLFAGFVLGTAQQMGYELRWGGDWNGNWSVTDNKFDDLVHFEFVRDVNAELDDDDSIPF